MFDRQKKIIERIQILPKGSPSPSGRYWCVTCKKMFHLDGPTCPYMTKMCINTPIAVENLPPEGSAWLEKMALFYPKIQQRLLSSLLSEKPSDIGKFWATEYLTFLDDWKIVCTHDPLQTMKSFILITSGCETAQRVDQEEITFVLTDMEKIWEKDVLFPVLEKGLAELRTVLNVRHRLKLDEMSILGERDMGKYFCGMCHKFFEFGLKREKVTCPLMAQKCMFDPVDIQNMTYSLKDLTKVYNITPNLHKRYFEKLPNASKGKGVLKSMLTDEWKFQFDETEFREFGQAIGLP
jgi:hypothetical protein